ncbi:unnamed protein product [Symbiodinium sp. CCMP2592]|nr:unnamed protein product [Symbiodinium sp. CCMP2592]
MLPVLLVLQATTLPAGRTLLAPTRCLANGQKLCGSSANLAPRSTRSTFSSHVTGFWRGSETDAVRDHEAALADAALIEATTRRLRSNPPVYQPFPQVPAAQAWLAYPVLIVQGPSQTGKTEWVKSLFKEPLELKVGCLDVFPEGMRAFDRKRHVVLLRDVQGSTWEAIRSQVRNLRGEHPSISLLKRVYKDFDEAKGQRQYNYKNCGRRPVKATKAVQKFLVQRLLALRLQCVCTSSTLQRELLAKKGVQLDESAIRKALRRQGCYWLPKAQKRKYSAERRQERLRFAQGVVQLGRRRLREKLSFSMDGVLLSLPPRDPIDRRNYCAHGDGFMWRQRGEAGMERLAGQKPYPSQFPQNRAVPLWGGLSEGGVPHSGFHKSRKFTAAEWCSVVRRGRLKAAIQALQPVKPDGSHRSGDGNSTVDGGRKSIYLIDGSRLTTSATTMAASAEAAAPLVTMAFGELGLSAGLCDNESFLHTVSSKRTMAAEGITVWPVPASSPDLNPVERFWAWLRKRIHHLDREDLRQKRPPIGMLAFKARVRAILSSRRAQSVAARIAGGLKKTCKEVIAKKGGMARS